MILVDTALAKREAEGNPIRVGIVGAGFMASGVIHMLLQYTQGMRLIGIASRTPEKAKLAIERDSKEAKFVESEAELELAYENGAVAYTNNPMLLTTSPFIDVIVEITGSVEYAAKVAESAIENKKHIVLMNPELDGTLGPILNKKAKEAGVVLTNVEGDQPGVTMNLYRFVKGLGLKPVLCGNIKGLHDPYRNPTTQEAFAKKWGQNPHMVTSFADGTKISFEQAIVGNGTGMGVGKRGMFGPTVEPGTHVKDAANLYPLEALTKGEGIVDYIVAAEPAPGVFVYATTDDPIQQHYLNLYKLGEGPLYCFYTPYHLCHFEVPSTIARAVLFGDAALAPLGAPVVEVVATAKTELKKGALLDGLGGYDTYGLAENAKDARKSDLLPIGLAEGATLKVDVAKDECLQLSHVELPKENVAVKLWFEQLKLFGVKLILLFQLCSEIFPFSQYLSLI